MKSIDPLLDSWQQTLRRIKDRPAVLSRQGDVLREFRDIEERARDFEAKLEMFRAGSVIAIQLGNHEDWPSILIACLRRQVVALPLEQSINDQQRDAALVLCRASAVVSAVPSGDSPQIVCLKTADATADWDRQPSLLKLTSGTTAAPRAIRFRSHQLLADCNQICETMGISDADLNFGVIPISHSYGFSNLLTPLIARGVPTVVSGDRTPRAILSDLVRSNATVFPGMPVFYQAFCEMEHVPALPKLRLCISAAGSGAPAEMQSRSFGSAGTCSISQGHHSRLREGFVGQPMDGIAIELFDPNAAASQIQVSSAAVADGYFPEPDDEKLSDGIFVPDDLLARDDSGFKIVGRISDVINVAGKKVNPAEVEALLLRFNGVRQAVVFGRGSALRNEEVAACVVVSPHVTEGDLLRFCRGALSAWQVPKRIFIMDAIPVNERGKISRRDLARRFSTPGASSPLPRLGS